MYPQSNKIKNPKFNLQDRVGSLIWREISQLLLISCPVNIVLSSLVLIVITDQQLSIPSPPSVLPSHKRHKQLQISFWFMETCKKRQSVDGSSTQEMMLLNGINVLVKLSVPILHVVVFTLFQWNRTFIVLEDSRWLKSHIKFKARVKTYFWCKWLINKWTFPNKTWSSLL